MSARRKALIVLGIAAAMVVAVGVGFYERPLAFFNQLLYLQMGFSGTHSRSVLVAGHEVHYDYAGAAEGPAVVLVHGLGGHAEDWRNLAPYFVKAGYRVYMPDLLGYGRSDRPANFSYSIPDEAASVVGFMDALGLKQVDLGGWSMGGWIVQRIAADHPERIRKLMLFDSAGLYDKPSWNTELFTPTNAQELGQLDALLMPHPPEVPPFIAGDILRQSRDHAWIIHRALNSMLTGRDVTDKLLPNLKMPVLIVWGSVDQITPLSEGQRIHQLIPQSRLEVIPGCGHLAPVQCTEQIGPKVIDFLQ